MHTQCSNGDFIYYQDGPYELSFPSELPLLFIEVRYGSWVRHRSSRIETGILAFGITGYEGLPWVASVSTHLTDLSGPREAEDSIKHFQSLLASGLCIKLTLPDLAALAVRKNLGNQIATVGGLTYLSKTYHQALPRTNHRRRTHKVG